MPYHPGIVDQRGQIYAGAINSASGSITALLNKLAQERDQEQEIRAMLADNRPLDVSGEAPDGGAGNIPGTPESSTEGSGEGAATQEDKYASAAKATKGLRDYAEGFHGFDKNMLTTLSLPQLQGLLRGTEFKTIMAERAQKMAQSAQAADQNAQLFPVQMQGHNLQNRVNMQALATQDAMTGMGRDLGDQMNPGIGPRPEINQAIFGALQRNPGAMNSPQLDNLLNVLERYGTGPQGAEPATHPLAGGYLGFTLPGTKQLDIRPDLTRPTQDVKGGFIDARGVFHATKPEADPQLRAVLHPVTRKPVEGFGMDASGKIHDLRSQSEKMLGPSAEPDPGSYEAQLKELGLTPEAADAAQRQALEPGPVAPPAKPSPKVGTVKSGYRFKGGNPADKNSWEKVK